MMTGAVASSLKDCSFSSFIGREPSESDALKRHGRFTTLSRSGSAFASSLPFAVVRTGGCENTIAFHHQARMRLACIR